MKNKLTLGSLFDGSGGFPLGGLIAGITPIWASEIEPFPIRVTTKRLPNVKHYGDISSLDGAKIEPVDMITFGSPCQNMSIAGKRDGLNGDRSRLFFEAVRIIKEMRCATNGKYPRYIVWENVCGSLSSNKGEDFRQVLEEICKIKDSSLSVPKSKKWHNAGEIVGDNFSVAWRVFDSQFWGVPQRRKRIYLVADLDDQCAGEILFESESLSGYSPQGFRSWQGSPADFRTSSQKSSLCLNDQGGQRMDVTEDVTCKLRAEAHHPPCVLDSAVCFENHSQDTRYTQLDGVAPTVSSTYGTGGNNQPVAVRVNPDKAVVEKHRCFDVRLTSEGTKNVRANVYPTDVARTLDTGGTSPDRNQGGVAVVGFSQEVYSTSKNSHHTQAEKELANTLVASDFKDPPTVNQGFTVRRLTPTECARLQGFPDWWCSDLGTENPTEEDISFWREVFETHRKVMGKSTKPKSDKQIIKWLKSPHSDSAEYKMWGNGVSLPVVVFVLSGIVWAAKKHDKIAT